MTKALLVLVVVAVFVWWLLGRQGRVRGGDAAPKGPGGEAEPMVCCAHCGVHLPRGDALIDGDGALAYCSPAHRAAGPRAR